MTGRSSDEELDSVADKAKKPKPPSLVSCCVWGGGGGNGIWWGVNNKAIYQKVNTPQWCFFVNGDQNSVPSGLALLQSAARCEKYTSKFKPCHYAVCKWLAYVTYTSCSDQNLEDEQVFKLNTTWLNKSHNDCFEYKFSELLSRL